MPSWSAKLTIFGFCANCPFGRLLCVVVPVALSSSQEWVEIKALQEIIVALQTFFFLTQKPKIFLGGIWETCQIFSFVLCILKPVLLTLPQHWHFSDLSWRHCKLGWCGSGFSCVNVKYKGQYPGLQCSTLYREKHSRKDRQSSQKALVSSPKPASRQCVDQVCLACSVSFPVVHG